MRPRKAAVAFIFVTVVLDMLAIGLIAPVLPQLVLGFLHNDTIQAAKMFGIFGTLFALMQFFFSPVLGVLSDRFGRRPVVLLSNFGLGFDYLIMAAAPTLGWLFLGRILSGITASSISTCMAYISDVVAPEKRAKAFGLIGAAFGLGFIFGPVLGGLLGTVSPRLPFWVAGALSLINAVYGYLILPESLPLERRRPFTFARANPIGSLKLLRSHHELLPVACIQFIGYVAHEIFNIWALYAIFRFAWGEAGIGLSLALVGVCQILVSAGLVGLAMTRLGEKKAMWLGQLFGAIGMLVAGLARTGGSYLSCIPVISLWSIAGPAAQGIMTRSVSPSQQGELQGAITSLRSIATIVGPGLFTFTFAFFIDGHAGRNLPGAPWYLASALLFLSVIMTLRLKLSTDQPAEVKAAATEPSSIAPPSI